MPYKILSKELLPTSRGRRVLEPRIANCKTLCTMRGMAVSTFPGYLTVNEAAEVIERSHSQVTRYISAGLLKAIKQGNQWFIPEDQLKKFKPPPRGNPDFRDQSAK